MPVSKKRKKSGKAVQRKAAVVAGAEHAHGPESKQTGMMKQGKPANPFVAKQQARHSGANRGR